MEHLWDDAGFFYYRVLRICTIRTSYMRWSQAWMFLASPRFSASRRCLATETSPSRQPQTSTGQVKVVDPAHVLLITPARNEAEFVEADPQVCGFADSPPAALGDRE